MAGTEIKIVASVIVGKKYSTILCREVSIRHVLQQFFNPKVGRTEWRIIYGLCEDGTSTAIEGFTSFQSAMENLKQVRPLDEEGSPEKKGAQ